MNATFKTTQDAIDAGFTPANRVAHKDVSGAGSFGYEYQDADGNLTVIVSLTEETNKLGRKGAYAPMFPPR